MASIITGLNAEVITTLRESGISLKDWFEFNYVSSGVWLGDVCGCTDDRCIGFHHDGPDDCGCFPAMLDEYRRKLGKA